MLLPVFLCVAVKGNGFADKGSGTDNGHRRNIHTLDWEGNAWFAGNITAGNITFKYNGKTYNLGEVIESLEKLTNQ